MKLLSYPLILAALTASLNAQSPEVVASGKYLLVDYRPFFPIGLYHLPDKRTDDAIWKEIADAGFNLLNSNESGRHGVYVAMRIPWDKGTGRNYNLMETHRDPSYPERLKRFLRENEEDSTILVWHAPDEPSYFGPGAEVLRPGYELIQAHSDKPVWLNIGPSFMHQYYYNPPIAFTAPLDVFSQDIYPIPDGKTKDGQSNNIHAHQVGLNADSLVKMLSVNGIQQKPLWMVLQGFGWGDFDVFDNPKSFVAPTKHELRFMTYDAIVNGATGVLYYGPFETKTPTNAQFWTDLKDMVRELQRNYDFLTCTWSLNPDHITVTNPDGDTINEIQFLIKLMSEKVVILAVNSSKEPLKDVRMTFSGEDNGSISYIRVLEESRDPEESRELEVIDNLSWKDDFEGYGVHLYETYLYYGKLRRYYKPIK